MTTVPGVSRMHAGMFGEVATYLPGRRVIGVQLREDVANVHVVLRWGATVPDTVDTIRAVLLPVVDLPVHVTVEDVDAEPDARS
ncbi:MAG: Asp23/Gls24 family envelope stress response protein [Actinomycetota bacterium]|nr:Asp23/Gls24 family envelope stress response protein [Actinomycetota bacterium]